MQPLPDSPTLADGISSWNDFQRQPFIKGRSNTEASQYWRQYQAAGRKGGGEKGKKSNGAKEERKAPAKPKPKPQPKPQPKPKPIKDETTDEAEGAAIGAAQGAPKDASVAVERDVKKEDEGKEPKAPAPQKSTRPMPEPLPGMEPLPDSPTLADGIPTWNDFQRQPFIKGRSNTEASRYWQMYQAAGRKGVGEKAVAAWQEKKAQQQTQRSSSRRAKEKEPGEAEGQVKQEAEKEGRHSGRGRSRKAVVAYDPDEEAAKPQWTNKTDEEKEEERERKKQRAAERRRQGDDSSSDEDGLELEFYPGSGACDDLLLNIVNAPLPPLWWETILAISNTPNRSDVQSCCCSQGCPWDAAENADAEHEPETGSVSSAPRGPQRSRRRCRRCCQRRRQRR